MVIPRSLLAEGLGGNPRLVDAFERQSQAVDDVADQAASNADATTALADASFITLAPNSTLTGERVLYLGTGLSAVDGGDRLTLSVNDTVPHVAGGFRTQVTVLGPTSVVFPLEGQLVARASKDTLSQKTLAAPSITGLGNYANDAAAAAGGVPVGGIYRSASQLLVRVA